ncbi:MAG: tRNA (adenosine(37)-N6)-dimethylallyltransferase MiaA [Bacteroidales bacterium]|nr:tRNA (adenosine(37)-N6)-dimethylallyltransferase MiaA [Bacteroidales bacterium]
MKTLIIITGPTASGKTDLAVKLAQYYSTEIISADSRQIFREMRIGTAVPDDETLAKVTHHMVQTRSVKDYYNAFMYETEVIDLLEKNLFERYDTVVMCGGSMMYVDAVCNGIDLIPDPDIEIRNNLWQQFEKEGIEPLRQKLLLLDPDYYKICDLNNHKRIIKALEVSIQTGKPYSTFRTGNKKERSFKIIKLGLNLPREILHQRINQRVDKMIGEGLVDEARRLYPLRSLNSLNTVGYRELFDYFDNKTTLETAIELIKRNTRRYARKQISWFNGDKDLVWFMPESVDDIINYCNSKILG